MANYDLSSIMLSVNLGDTKKITNDVKALIAALEEKKIKLEIDSSGIKASLSVVAGEIEKAYKKANEGAKSAKKENEELAKSMNTLYKTSMIDNTSIDSFKKSIQDVRQDIVNLQSTKVTYGIDDEGIKSVNGAVLTYTNNIGKMVTETMGYKKVINDVTGEAERQWSTLSIVETNNVDAIRKNIEAIELFKQKMNFEISEKLKIKDIDPAKLNELVNKMDSLQASGGNASQQIKLLKNEFDDLFKNSSKIGENVLGTKTIEEEIQRAERAITKFLDMKNKQLGSQLAGTNGTLIPNLQEYDTLIAKMNELQNMKIDSSNLKTYIDTVREVRVSYDNLINKTKEVTTTAKEMDSSFKISTDIENKVRNYATQLEILANKNKDIASNPLYQQVEKDIVALSKADKPLKQLSAETNVVDNNMKKLKESISGVGNATNVFSKLGQSIKSAFSFVSLTMVMYKFSSAIREIPSLVTDVDTSLVEMNKVARLSTSELEAFTDSAYKTGETLAKTGNQVIQASTEFVKAGYDIAEASNLAKDALLSMNVGSGMSDSLDEAVSSMIATLKGFGMEATKSGEIVDKMAKVADTCAVSYAELASGVERSSAVLSAGGFTFEETIASLTGVYEVTRNMEKSSTGLNTIIQRIRGINDEGEFCEETLAGVEKKMYEIAGIKLKDDITGQLRSSFDVLSDLQEVWADLSTNQQAILSESVSGKRQSVVLQALLKNWESVDKAIQSTADSAGYAEEVNAVYLDSINGKLAALKSSWEQLATNTLSSDLVKDIIEITTSTIKLVDSVGGLVPVLTTIIGLVTLLKSQSIATSLTSFATNTIPAIVSGMTAGKVSIMGYKVATDAATVSTTALGVAMNMAVPFMAVIGLALSGLVMGVNSYKRAQEELNQELLDSINTYESDVKALEDVKSRYNSLADAYSDSNLTNEKRNQLDNDLLGIQNDLIKKYPQLYGELDLLNKSQEENNRLIQEQIDLEKQRGQRDATKYLSENGYDTTSLDSLATKYDNASKSVESLNDKIAEARKSGNEYAEKTYTAQLKNQERVMQETEDAIKDLIPILAEAGGEWEEYGKKFAEALRLSSDGGLEDASDGVDNVDESVKNATTTLEEATKAFNNAKDAISDLEGALDKLNKGNGITADIVSEIAEKYPELLSCLGSEEELRQGLIDKIEEQKSAQSQAYKDMLYSSEEYYNNRINGDATMYNELKNAMQIYFDNLNTGYTVDLSRYKNLEQAKAEVTSELIKQLAGAWAEYFDATTGVFDTQKFEEGSGTPSKLLDKRIQEGLAMQGKIQEAISKFDSIALKGVDLSLKDVGGGSSSGSGSSSSKSNLETEIDKLIATIDSKIAVLKEKISLAELKGDTELAETLNKELDGLYAKKISLLEKNESEIAKLKNTYKSKEDIASIDKKLLDNAKDYASTQKEYMNFEIDMLDKRYDARLKLLELETEEISYKQKRLDESTDEFLKYEKEKYAIATKIREEYEKKLKDAELTGVLDGSEYITSIKQALRNAEQEEYEVYLENIEVEYKVRSARINNADELKSQIQDVLSIAVETESDVDVVIGLREQVSKLNLAQIEENKHLIAVTKELRDAQDVGSDKYVQHTNTLNDAIAKQSDLLLDQINIYKDLAKNKAELSVYGSIGKDGWIEQNNEAINSLNKEIAALEKINKEKDRQAEIEKKILEIKELELKLEELKNNKKVQVLSLDEDGNWQWEYIADYKEMQKTEEEINQSREELDKMYEEERRESKIEELKWQIEKLQEEANSKLEAYNKMEKEYTEHSLKQLKITKESMVNINKETDNGMKVVNTTVDTSMKTLKSTYDTGLGNVLNSVRNYMSQIRAELADVESAKAEMNNQLNGTTKTSGFATGGLNTSTGWQLLHGTQANPERVLSAQQTKTFDKMVSILPTVTDAMSKFLDFGNVTNIDKSESNKSLVINKLELPNVSNAKSFVEEINRLIDGMSQQASIIPAK